MKLEDMKQEKPAKLDDMKQEKPVKMAGMVDMQKQDMQKQDDMQVVRNDKDSQGMIMVDKLKRADMP
jgi:hypothetical protein